MAPRVIPFGVGLRGSDDFLAQSLYDAAGTAQDQQLRPKNYREAMLWLEPNGSCPLTGMSSGLRSEATNDPEYYWYEKTIPDQDGSVVGMYTDADCATAVSAAQAAEAVIFLKISTADAKQVRAGHVLVLRDASAASIRTNCYVQAKSTISADYVCLRVVLLEALTTAGVSGVDIYMIIGNANAEGAVIPDSITYDAVQIYNYTQIFRTPLEITRTARKTKLRTGDALKEMQREALLLHGMEIEKAYLWGTKYSGTGDNGKPLHMTGGLIPMSIAYGTTGDYTTDTDYSGDSWTTGGENWLNEKLEVIFRYGSNRRMAYCGSGALLGIQRLARAGANLNIQVGQNRYGVTILNWITPFGEVMFHTHPLFSQNAVDRYRMLLFEPKNLVERYIDQTHYKKDNGEGEAGYQAIDGVKTEYLTEAGLEFHHLSTTAVLDGFNQDNDLS